MIILGERWKPVGVARRSDIEVELEPARVLFATLSGGKRADAKGRACLWKNDETEAASASDRNEVAGFLHSRARARSCVQRERAIGNTIGNSVSRHGGSQVHLLSTQRVNARLNYRTWRCVAPPQIAPGYAENAESIANVISPRLSAELSLRSGCALWARAPAAYRDNGVKWSIDTWNVNICSLQPRVSRCRPGSPYVARERQTGINNLEGELERGRLYFANANPRSIIGLSFIGVHDEVRNNGVCEMADAGFRLRIISFLSALKGPSFP